MTLATELTAQRIRPRVAEGKVIALTTHRDAEISDEQYESLGVHPDDLGHIDQRTTGYAPLVHTSNPAAPAQAVYDWDSGKWADA